MNRREFMRQLEKLLGDVSEEERRDALAFYEGYFEDAGPENEAKVIEELGSPEKIAATIKADLFGENFNPNAYTKKRAEDERLREERNRQQNQNKLLRNIMIAAVIILTFPFWVGIVGMLFGLVVGAVCIVFAGAIGVIACVAAFLIFGCIMFGIGIAQIFGGFPAIGLLLTGISLLMLAVGILGMIAAIWVLGKLVPWLIRGIVNICSRLLHRRGEEKTL